MKSKTCCREAIDESLSGVRFNARDMRAVLSAVREQEAPQEAPVRAGRHRRLDLVFSLALVAMVAIPVSLFAVNARNAKTTPVTVAAGAITSAPSASVLPDAAPTDAPLATAQPEPQDTLSEAEAIAAARACFEAECDTSVFSFDEYTVSLTETAETDGSPSMTVLMQSIYDNGCFFTVVLDAQNGGVLRFSTPQLATVPTFLNGESAEVQAWYDKLGPFAFTWSQENQAEFSRRYEGAALRMARSGELSAADAQATALKAASDTFAQLGETGAHYAYPALYGERASADGIARYFVRCYAQPVTQTLPSPCVLVTLRAGDGMVESIQIVEDEAQALTPALNMEE